MSLPTPPWRAWRWPRRASRTPVPPSCVEALNPFDFPRYGLQPRARTLPRSCVAHVRPRRADVRVLFDAYHVQRTEGDVLRARCAHAPRHIGARPDRGRAGSRPTGQRHARLRALLRRARACPATTAGWAWSTCPRPIPPTPSPGSPPARTEAVAILPPRAGARPRIARPSRDPVAARHAGRPRGCAAAFSAMRSRVRSEAEAMWGTMRQLGRPTSGWSARQGLRVRDIQSGAEELPGAQRVRQGFLVDDRTAAGVDEDGTALHACERRRIDHVARLRSQHGVQAHVSPIRQGPSPGAPSVAFSSASTRHRRARGRGTGCASRSPGRGGPSRARCARSR